MSEKSSELSGLARPYATAIFDLAKAGGDYATWSDQLAFLVNIASDTNMIHAIQSPAISEAQLTELVLSVGEGQLSDEAQNLVKLLIHNGRMNTLPEINRQYLVLRDEAEQIIEAQLVTAAKVGEAQMKSIENALSTRLGKKIKLEAVVDEALIGGAIVRAGDWVVDASVKAQLQDLVGAIGA